MYYYVNYLWIGRWQNCWRQLNVPPLRHISMAMKARWSNTDGIAWCSMSMATPEATGCCHRATTLSVLPRQPPGWQQTKQRQKMYHNCWPFRWPWRCAGMIPRTLPDREDPAGLWQKPLVAATGRVLRPTVAIWHKKTCLFSSVFIVNLLQKGLSWRQGPY